MFRRSAGVIAGSLALVIGLSGCSLLQAGGGEEPLTGVAACALGNTWQLDVENFTPQVQEELLRRGIPNTTEITGGQTLDWNADGHVLLTTDMVLDVFVQVTPDFAVEINEPHTGSVTGAAYITGEVAIPRRWDDTDLSIQTIATSGGTEMEEAPWDMPPVIIDDSVGLELTCDGDTLTIHPRGGNLTMQWTKTGPSTI